MVGHLAVPSLTAGKTVPASVSQGIIKGLLREELGFGGVVVSDALNMHSVSRLFPGKGQLEWEAFLAGNDVLCFAEHIAEGIDAIVSRATDDQLEASFRRVWDLKQKVFSNTLPAVEAVMDNKELMDELAVNCLTEFKGTSEELAGFRKGAFTILEIGPEQDRIFTQNIEKIEACRDVMQLLPDATAFKTMSPHQKLLLSIYLPSAKPPGAFGMGDALLNYINRLLQEHDVVLYLFGNPYFLNHLDIASTRAIVVAYQEFAEFQEVAAKHFKGLTSVRGKLPITLNAFNK